MKRHLALVLIVIALFVKFWPGRGLNSHSDQVSGALTVRGLHLGMTRKEVLQKLGPPLEEVESDIYRHFKETRYKQSQGFGDPEIIYDAQGLAVSVSGETLEWPGGSLSRSVGLKQVMRFFPELLELRTPIYHPYMPGAYYAEGRNLMLSLESGGMFSTPNFVRAELTVPYLTFEVRPNQFKNRLLSDTADRIKRPNRLKLLNSRAIGCFQCCRVLHTQPKWPADPQHRDWGVCPYCDQDMLVGGSSSEITPEFLSLLHKAWLGT